MTPDVCPLPVNTRAHYPRPAPLPAVLPWRSPVALALRLAAAAKATPPAPVAPRLTLHTRPRGRP